MTNYYVNGRKVGQVDTYNYALNREIVSEDIMRLAERDRSKKQGLNVVIAGYLRRHTIFSNEELSGAVTVEYQSGSSVIVNIPIRNDVYIFEWK